MGRHIWDEDYDWEASGQSVDDGRRTPSPEAVAALEEHDRSIKEQRRTGVPDFSRRPPAYRPKVIEIGDRHRLGLVYRWSTAGHFPYAAAPLDVAKVRFNRSANRIDPGNDPVMVWEWDGPTGRMAGFDCTRDGVLYLVKHASEWSFGRRADSVFLTASEDQAKGIVSQVNRPYIDVRGETRNTHWVEAISYYAEEVGY